MRLLAPIGAYYEFQTMVDFNNNMLIKFDRYSWWFFRDFIIMNLIDYILKKEKDMEKESQELQDNSGIVDLEELAKKVLIHPYFGMDSVSGDMVSFFSSGNVKAAVRSFCNSLDHLPLSMVKDFVLVDGVTREIVYDGKDYVDQWKENQNYRLEEMIRNWRGARNA